jgi:amidase
LAKGKLPGPLHGLPHAVKDLVPTAGIRTTFGSRIYKDFVPVTDGLIVERLKGAGAIIIGKTNTPEFGAGSHTFNEVFGATHNPYDLARTCGGSSGGAAVALACGMVPLADGSDLGGSLRIRPASAT